MTFEQAMDYYKTGTAIARVLRKSRSRISQFKHAGGFPYEIQCVLEIDSGGVLVASRNDDPGTHSE